MPYTAKQMAFFRFAMHDKKRSASERAEYRKMYNEGVKRGEHKRKPESSSGRQKHSRPVQKKHKS